MSGLSLSKTAVCDKQSHDATEGMSGLASLPMTNTLRHGPRAGGTAQWFRVAAALAASVSDCS